MNNLSDEFLDKMRLTGDLLADNVAEILWKNRDRNILEDLRVLSKFHTHNLSKNIDKLNLDVPLSKEDLKYFEKYYEFTDHYQDLVTEKDKEDFKINAELFNRYGYFIVCILFFKSLPTGYMCPKPGFVLHTTKLLENFAARRVMETAQFIFAVNKPDWYKSGTKGLQSIEK
ncbi:MAG: hypothetical protein AAGK97_14870, partial [Bacteroidota bacterium]